MVEEERAAGGGEIKLPVAFRSLAYLQGYRCGRSFALSYIRAPLPYEDPKVHGE